MKLQELMDSLETLANDISCAVDIEDYCSQVKHDTVYDEFENTLNIMSEDGKLDLWIDPNELDRTVFDVMIMTIHKHGDWNGLYVDFRGLLIERLRQKMNVSAIKESES